MKDINNGGLAYPLRIEYRDENGDLMDAETNYGLTKRQVYAKDAMKGMLANPAYIDTPQQKWIAEQAYKQADAMLAFEANESK